MLQHVRFKHASRAALLFLASGLAINSAYAEGPSLPPAAEPWADHLTYVGQVSGLNAWTIDGAAGLVMAAPDGVSLILGNAFSGQGQDLAAVHHDKSPMAVDDVLAGALNGLDATNDRPPESAQSPTVNAPTANAPEATPVAAATSYSAYPDHINGPDFTEAAENLFWMTVGNSQAPGVFVTIDPTCPFCSEAMVRLKDLVEQGDLHLRVIMTPYMSQRSIGLTIDMMRHDEPPVAFWQHEIEYGQRQSTPLEPAAMDNLTAEGRALLETNIFWMRDNDLPGVPLFFWIENGEWQTSFGVTEPSVFANAQTLPAPNTVWKNLPADHEFVW